MKSHNRIANIKRIRASRYGGLVVIICVILLIVGLRVDANSAGGYGNPSAASPVRSATTPLSSYRSDLVTRPNPIDNSSNLVVTGNVGAGKHFRDSLPYRSTTSMDAPLGTRTLDSFMRYTAVPQTSATPAGTYNPFYSASGTATTLQPGTGSVFLPNSARVGTSVTPRLSDTPQDTLLSGTSVRMLAPEQAELTGQDDSASPPRLQLWPSSLNPEATADSRPLGRGWTQLQERRTDGTVPKPAEFDASAPAASERLTGDAYRQQMEALQRRLSTVGSDVTQLEQSLTPREDAARMPLTPPVSELADSGEPTMPDGSRREQLLQETARLLAATTGLPANPSQSKDTMPWDNETDDASDMRSAGYQRLRLYDPSQALAQAESLSSRSRIEAYRSEPDRVGLARPQTREGIGGASPTLRTPAPRTAPEMPVVQTSVQPPVAKAEVEPTAVSLKEFTRHLQLAERFFQRRQYRHAAETYALAAAYRPTDPRPHLRRSHALLAIGEYDAGAMALARAMELDAQYVLKKIDLIQAVGGPDAFIARFNALDETAQTGDAPMLQFLLAYILHQMDRSQEARTAIETAQRLLPSSVPIDLLKAAIFR